jgi:hypothetical protein
MPIVIRTAAGSIFPTISLAVQSLDSVLLLGADLEAGEYAAFFAIVCERKSLQRNLHALADFLADERLDRVMHVGVVSGCGFRGDVNPDRVAQSKLFVRPAFGADDAPLGSWSP